MSNIDPAIVESLPKELLETLPAAQPPPGVTPNFANPPNYESEIVGVPGAFLAIALVTFILRIYTKARITRKWQWDDLTILLGLLLAVLYYVAASVSTVNGAAGRHAWDLRLVRILNNRTLTMTLIEIIITIPGLGLVKSSFFIQYYTLFSSLRWIRVGVWLGAAVAVTFYVVVTIATFALICPRPGESVIRVFLSKNFERATAFSIATGVVGTLVDWYLLILPIPAVLGLKMSKGRKFGVLLVFMSGAVAAISSIVTLYYRVRYQLDPTDVSWKSGYQFIWTQMEMFAGIIASNMPTVKHFFSHYETQFHKIRNKFMSSATTRDSFSHQGEMYHGTIFSNDLVMRGLMNRTATKAKSIHTRSSTEKLSYSQDLQIHVTHEVDVQTIERQKTAIKPHIAPDTSWLDLRES